MCDCVQLVDEAWKEEGYRVDVTMFLDGTPSRISYQLVSSDPFSKKLKSKSVISVYCPICGQKYPERKKHVQSS